MIMTLNIWEATCAVLKFPGNIKILQLLHGRVNKIINRPIHSTAYKVTPKRAPLFTNEGEIYLKTFLSTALLLTYLARSINM